MKACRGSRHGEGELAAIELFRRADIAVDVLEDETKPHRLRAFLSKRGEDRAGD